MRVYLSGTISQGDTLSPAQIDANLQRFELAEIALLGVHEVVSPIRHGRSHRTHPRSWADYMRLNIADLLTCDAILMLKGWQASPGATFERLIAKRLGMRVAYSLEELGG